MRKTTRTPLQRALKQEKQRLSTAQYPGDLADDVLRDSPEPRGIRWALVPTLATAILGLGITLVIVVMRPQAPPQDTAPIAQAQPEQAATEQQDTPSAQPAQPDTPLPPNDAIAEKPAIPEIDRGLLPLQRNSQATWLASARTHKEQLDKQSRLAEHPKPNKRLKLTLSAPTRREIGRATARPLNLQPASKPERTS